METIPKSTELIIILAIILAGIITVALFKEVNGATFLNLDEMLWMRRADVFKDHILSGNFSGLIQSSQPGIMVMWLAGPMMHLVDFFDFEVISKMIAYKETQGLDFNSVANVNDPIIYAQFKEISFLFNLPFLAAIFSALLIGYHLLKKLGFNKNISLIALTFIVTTPWYMYFTTPSDKGLMIFITLSLLFLMVYGNNEDDYQLFPSREGLGVGFSANLTHPQPPPKRGLLILNRKKFLIISAVLAAWAVLSKLTALFFIFLVPFILLFYAWPLSKVKIKLLFKDCLIWTAIFFITLTIFLPTIIFNPREVIDFLIHPAPMILENNYQPISYFSRIGEYFKEFIMVIPGYMSPAPAIFFGIFTVIILASAILKKIARKIPLIPFEKSGIKHLVILTTYLIFFTLMVVFLSHNHDIRFLAPVFIVMDILAATGVYWLVEIARKKFGFKENIYSLVIFLLIITQMIYIVGNGAVFNQN